jgi:hypothetical protein
MRFASNCTWRISDLPYADVFEQEAGMGWFGWRNAKAPRPTEPAIAAISGVFDPLTILQALDKAVPQYMSRVDRGDLIYPACTRSLTDVDGNVRSIWEHTRIEAMRYVMMVPRREVELLIDPVRQPEMLDAFLRRSPHEDTVIGFTGVPIDDLVIAVVAGLNWLNHCAVLAGVEHSKFSGTLRNFRKFVVVAQQWWAIDGADARCVQMLMRQEKPPLMLYLIWQEYTRLAKEIATAAIYGSSIERATASTRKPLRSDPADRPEVSAALTVLTETMARLEDARDPDDLLR